MSTSENRDRGSVSRRSFVRQTGLAAGAAFLGAPCADQAAGAPSPVHDLPPVTPGGIPRRVLGRTGVPLTVLTLGTAPCGAFPPPQIADLVRAAIDAGITAVDTSEKYQNSQEGVGLGLAHRRDQVFLSTKVFANTIAEAEESLRTSIRTLKTDHFDLLYYHSLGNIKVDNARTAEGVFTWLLKQKKAGVCRFLGISGHNIPSRFAPFLESGDVDVLLAAMNFVDRHTYRFEEDVLPIARKHNAGVVAMKVYGGAAKMDYNKPKASRMPPEHIAAAFRYALSLPGVTTANIGVHSVEQIHDNIRMAKEFRPLSQPELAALLAQGKQMAAQWGEHFGPVKEKATA